MEWSAPPVRLGSLIPELRAISLSQGAPADPGRAQEGNLSDYDQPRPPARHSNQRLPARRPRRPHPLGRAPELATLSDDGQAVTARPWPLHDLLWRTGEPRDILPAIAATINALDQIATGNSQAACAGSPRRANRRNNVPHPAWCGMVR